MKKLFIIVTSLLLVCANFSANAQANVLDPNDPDVIFTSSNQPAVPTWNQISKWGHTVRLSWNPYSYGYKSYYFQGMAFRLVFPKSYKAGVNDGKKYPIFVFYHGLGETGNIWDNEYQLYHGGQTWAQAVKDSAFDGFILVPQSQSGYLQTYFPAVSSLIDSMVKYTKLDIDRVTIDGLSGGGQATWEMLATPSYAQKVCSALPISAADYDQEPKFASFITIPIWVANGGKDVAPYPSTVTDIINYYKSLGGNIIQDLFPNDGHGCWDDFWADPNFWPWINQQHKANPLVYFQHNSFCPGATVSAKLALQAGFYAYQWQKNGVTISGAIGDSLNVTTYGTYAGRYQRTSTSGWSPWSPTPVVVSQMQPTVTPPIQINGLHSNVLPAPDGSTTVPLMVPNTYASYQWHKVNGIDSIVSTTNTYNAPVGQYKVSVTQQFGCSSNFSPIDTVIAANGTKVPPPASNASALAISSGSIELDWNANPNPQYIQTAFEVYRTSTSGSNYTLVAITGANALTYVDHGLLPNVKYYYIIRAINSNGASAVTAEANAVTLSDITPPTVPANLKITGTTRSSISLAWDPSTDDIAVSYYDIYINGVKAYSTPNTTFTVNNLTALQTYSFYVKARDASGNISPASAQVSGTAALNGLSYSYYQGTWSVLPDFTTLTPISTGIVPNVSLTQALQNVDYGFLWQGSIIIPVTGNYTFETNSDDGSDLYIGQYSPTATPLVNNDGLHGAQNATGTIKLNAGIYPIAITYFQNGGGASMNIYWKSTAAGITTFTAIPNSAFADAFTTGAIPAKPGFLTATATSYNRVALSWTDNSSNETGFEISRATLRTGDYQALGTVGANVTSFIDSVGLTANTKYWYKIRAVNTNGASGYVSTLEGNWLFNNDLTDASGNNHTLTGSGSPAFSTDSKEGGSSISLNGTNQYADMAFSTGGTFPSNSYTTRTVAIWIKPTTATINAANGIVYDLGGADNGIALRFSSGALQVGIASGSVRSTVVVSSIATNAKWVSGGWNHVVVVYNVNTLQLFVNGNLMGTTSLSFSSVSAAATGSRIGATNGTNAFNSGANSYYGGLIDDAEIITEPVNAAGATALLNQSYTADTTLVLPAVPAAPSNLTGVALSPSFISLSFKDNSTNETGFQLYRAMLSDTNFRLQATLASVSGSGTTINYKDTSLYANTSYYYRVRAIGVGGNSAFTSPDPLIVTLNDKPTIKQIASFTMRYNAQVSVSVSATDVDGDPVTFTVLNLPSFGTFSNGGSNTGTLVLNPAVIANQGSFVISVVAHDNHSGTDTTKFTVTVNSNYTPVAKAISNQSVNEGDSLVIPLSATDQDGNGTLVWSITSAPSFITVGSTVNGAASLTLKPGYAAAGTYTVTVSVNDGSGGIAPVSFTLTVIDKAPPSENIYMDMRYTSANAPVPWNNISSVSTSGLLNSTGQATNVGLQFIGTPWNAGNAGAVTGNNSGVYPDAAMSDYFWFGIYGAPSTVNVNLTGLSKTSKYNVTLFGSSTYTGSGPNGTTVYTINGVGKPINISNNTQNTITFSSIAPDTTGTITVNLSVTPGTPYGVLNTIVLQRPFDDGTKPMLPTNLAAQALPNGYVQLSWKDVAYNESNYLVYRSTLAAGPFTLLSRAGNANDTTYTDSTVSSNTTYYYEIAATNANGSSGLTAAVSATTSNKAPVLTALNDVYVKTGTSATVNIAASDDPNNILTTTVSNMPSFATYTSTGNGTGKIVLTPGINDVGVYKNIVVKVADNFGASISDTFNVNITDSSLRSVYLNFGSPSNLPQPAPWNNFLVYPFANFPISNLMDDANTNTGFSFKLLDQWDGNLAYGMITGNNSGVFPDNVLQNSFYSGNTNAHIVEIDGLNPAKKYDLGFLTSFNSGDTALVTFTSGTQTSTADGRYNTSTLAQLNGLVPNASGAIQVTIAKAAKTLYLSLNGLVIQEYLSSTPIVRPYDLFAATVLDTSTIQLNWTDKSNNETGFQIYRSTSVNGTYTLVTTTAANVTTYTNTGLTPDTRYYYKVRAINGSVTSNYSNVATAVLASNIVLINLTADVTKNGPSPWNNTDFISLPGAVISNLININTINTGDEMTITRQFENTGFAGVSGAGIFPANVMISNYWTDASETSEVLFDNLDVRKKYRIGCFGSNATANYTTGIYTINGQSVYLNSYDNNSKIVYLDKLTPNSNGQIYLDISTLAGSPYSFTGAFTIESFDDTATYVPPVLSRPTEEAVTAVPVAVAATNNIRVYPNPFTNKLTVELGDVKPSTVGLTLYDASSNLVYKGETTKQSGNQQLNVELPNAGRLATGTYILNVTLDGKTSKSVMLIKVN